MGFFNKIFNTDNTPSKEEAKTTSWIEITKMEILDEITEISQAQTVAIFKHSTSCIISRRVLKEFEQNYEHNDQIKLYFLDLLMYRNVSNEIATRFNVRHESPQLIVLKNNIVIYNASHSEINAKKLKDFF